MKRHLLLSAWLSCALAWPVQAKPYEPKVENVEVPPPVVLPNLPPEGEVSSKPLSAHEAARIALARQPQIKVARHQIQAQEGRTEQARSGLRPQLGLGATYTDILVPQSLAGLFGNLGSGTGTATSGAAGGGLAGFNQDSFGFSATLRQLLFDFQHTRDLVSQSEEQEKAASANLDKVQQETVFNVKQSFYQYLQSARLIQVQEANVANQREHLKQAQARFKAGLGLPSDVTRAQTAVADAVFNLTQARNDADIARVNLLIQMGIDPRTPILLEDKEEPEVSTEDPQKLFDQALAQRPEILQAQANLRANNFGLSAAATTSAPTVSASLGYTARMIDAVPQINSLNLVIAINWTAYDGGLEDGKVREAEANLAIAKAQLETIANSVVSDVAQTYYRLRTAEQRLKTAQVQEANAAETVRLADGRYKVGLGILLDVLDAQASLITAQTNRINAQTQISLARASLLKALGRPL